MAKYRYSTYLSPSTDDEFDKFFRPGERVGWSGIYRCVGCGYEVVHTNDIPLPPQNHHQHKPTQGKTIRWQLLVTDYSGKS
jgi:hypothetical protein